MNVPLMARVILKYGSRYLLPCMAGWLGRCKLQRAFVWMEERTWQRKRPYLNRMGSVNRSPVDKYGLRKHVCKMAGRVNRGLNLGNTIRCMSGIGLESSRRVSHTFWPSLFTNCLRHGVFQTDWKKANKSYRKKPADLRTPHQRTVLFACWMKSESCLRE